MEANNTILIYFPDTGGYNFTPPYELLFQYEALKNNQAQIILADARQEDFKSVFDKHRNELGLVIISTLCKYSSITISKQYEDGLKMSAYVKNKSDITVVWTGLAASVFFDILCKQPYIDYVFRGVSEAVLNELLPYLLNQTDIPDTETATYIKTNKQIQCSPLNAVNLFNRYGHFDLSLLNVPLYIHNYTFDYVASVGCVNRCGFCSVPVVYRQKWFHNNIETIATHIRYLLSQFSTIRVIHFRDDNFLVNKKFIFELMSFLSEKGLSFIWSAQGSINILRHYTDDDLLLLRRAGCTNISTGIESGDPYILEKVAHAKTDVKTSIHFIKRLIKAGIAPSVTSVISFPYNGGRDFNKTLRLLMKIKLLYPRLSLNCIIYQPIPKTETFNDIFKGRPYSEKVLENNSWTTKRQREKLKKFEYFYFTCCYARFYKSLPPEIGKKIKWINLLMFPFIKLRFILGITGFLWEYKLVATKVEYLKKTFDVTMDAAISDAGIRHHNTNYNYGYRIHADKTKN